MALKNQLNFASGELDPVLHDRVTLERFQNALDTARNVMIGKTGSIISRFSTEHLLNIAHSGNVKIYSPAEDVLLEVGVNSTNDKFYVNIYDYSGALLYNFEEATSGDYSVTNEDILNLQFTTDKDKVIFLFGSSKQREPLYVDYVNFTISGSLINDIFAIPASPVSASVSFTASGYDVDYAFTVVQNGEESLDTNTELSTPAKLPISVSEFADCSVVVRNSLSTPATEFNEVRVYRRPREGTAYGYIGSAEVEISGSQLVANFRDVGQDADFSNGIPSLVTREGINATQFLLDLDFATGVVYQGRLLLGNISDKKQAVTASRPGFTNNFYRDFPYDADSALLFKVGSEGNAKVLRMIDSNNGLVVFTSAGVFASVGLLSRDNSYLEKRGDWIIDESIPPIMVQGALMFVDKSTGSVRQLAFSQELQTFDAIDQSIFSNHLFREKTVSSWAFQKGSVPVLIVTFTDGTFATFTYSSEHQMRAWTRHDGKYPIEQVTSSDVPELSFFLVNKNGTRSIEKTVKRFPTLKELGIPENIYKGYDSLMDSIKVQYTLMNDLTGSDEFTLTPVTVGDWSGDLTLVNNAGIFTDPGAGATGNIFRFFNPEDMSVVDLTVKSRTSDNEVVVEPSEEFPSNYSTGFRLYGTALIVTGLSHLEGEEVSVMVDGDVIASPYNDHVNESFPTFTVTGGSITLPEEYRGAFIVVGRPIVSDIATLNVSTVEQSPTMLESLTANKLYIRVYNSRGLYVDNVFPENKTGKKDGTSVDKMQDFDNYTIKSGTKIIANRSKQPESKRVELTIPGAWDSQGKVAIRQVDPLHFEILSIILDLDVERR